MFAWFRQRLRAEEGISLIEMLVSILLMGLVLAALGSTLFATMAAARQHEGLTQATAIANEQLEKLQAASWASLNPASPPAASSVTRSGRTFTVTPFVQLPDPSNAQYKRYGVTVSWTENGAPHSINLEARRARRSGESNTPVAPINPFRALTFTVNPDPVNLDTTSKTLASTNPVLPGNAAMMLEVELNEAARTGSVIIAWPIPSPTSTLVLTEVAGSNGTRWSGTLPSGQTYPAGWMTFRASAAKAGTTTTCTASPPVSSDCMEATTAAYLMAPIENGPLYYDSNESRLYTNTTSAPGDRLCRNFSTGRLRNDMPVRLGLKGLGSDDSVTLVRTDVASPVYNLTWTNVSGVWWWTGTALASTAGIFTENVSSTWQLRWTRSYDNLTGTIPLVFRTINATGNAAC